MLDRFMLAFKIVAFNALLFTVFNLIVPPVIATTLSIVSVFGYVFLPENENEIIKLKRPTLYTKG